MDTVLKVCKIFKYYEQDCSIAFSELNKWISSTHELSKLISFCSINAKLFQEHKCCKASFIYEIFILVFFDSKIAEINILPML